MSIITDIQEAKGKGRRKHIYLDDNFVCTVDAFTVYKNKLKVGVEITELELEEIIFESEVLSGFERAVELISKNLKTKKQMREYLKEKGYLPRVVAAVIAKMEEYRYINDEMYAEIYTNDNLMRYGKQKIRFNLKMRGIDSEIIDNILEQTEIPEDAIYNLASKYMKNREPTRANFDKMCKHLVGKGFSWSEISPVLNRIKEEMSEGWD